MFDNVSIVLNLLVILTILAIPIVIYVSVKNIYNTRKKYYDQFLKDRDARQQSFDKKN